MSDLIIFEPENLRPFGPLVLLRSVSELRYGIYSNLERTQAIFPESKTQIWVRPILKASHELRYPELSINQDADEGSILLNAAIPAWNYSAFLLELKSVEQGLIIKDGSIVAAKTKRPIKFSREFHAELQALPVIECTPELCDNFPRWIWDYLDHITTAMEFDLPIWQAQNEWLKRLPADMASLDDRHIYIHNTAQIGKYVHMDASQGAIIIDADCKISPFTSLTGPLYIGKRSSTKPSTSIRHCVIGAVCNLGGELKGSIIHPYSNKSHDGFLGDSILGSWINLGAGTTTSNLKNNYQAIRVSWDGHNYETGRQFLGTILGDHTKTAIGVRLNTGTLIGIFCNVFQADFPPRSIPSFSWGNGIHELDKAIRTAKLVLARRNHSLSAAEEQIIRSLAIDNTPFTQF